MTRRLIRIGLFAGLWVHGGVAADVTPRAASASRVLWQRTYSAYSSTGSSHPAVLLRGPEGGFRVVGGSYVRQTPLPGGGETTWWVQDVNARGEPARFRDIAAGSDSSYVRDALVRGGDLLLLTDLSGSIIRIDAAGRVTRPVRARTGGPAGRAQIMCPTGDRLLLAGTIEFPGQRGMRHDAWLALVDERGTTVWEKSFDRSADETVQAILPAPDGGCVLAVNSGQYNKFGQGPSALWLIRCDAKGDKVAEAVIPDGRITASGRRYLARTAEGFVVSYTQSQLPPIDRVPLCSVPSFDVRLACFDDGLRLKWEKQYTPSTSFGTSLVLSSPEGGLLMVGAGLRLARFTRIDPAGAVVSETDVPLDGLFDPIDAVLDGHALVVLGRCPLLPATTGPASRPAIAGTLHGWILLAVAF